MTNSSSAVRTVIQPTRIRNKVWLRTSATDHLAQEAHYVPVVSSHTKRFSSLITLAVHRFGVELASQTGANGGMQTFPNNRVEETDDRYHEAPSGARISSSLSNRSPRFEPFLFRIKDLVYSLATANVLRG